MTRRFSLGQDEKISSWDLASQLNREQLAAATAPDGPMLIVAGAGSGKTRTLTYRIAWLIEQGVSPGRILLMTFTNRAARDMLQRVELLMQTEIRRIWGGTFHHIGNRILRQYGNRIAIKPDFTILDRDDSQALIKTCVAETTPELRKRRFPKKNVLNAIFSLAANTMKPLEEILEERFAEHADYYEQIAGIRKLYERKKKESNVLDFDDLLCRWLRLLQEDKEVRQILGEQFQHILVDEYQDTNALQAAIVNNLAECHRNICVVGDDAQAIYSFRGAVFDNVLNFQEQYPDSRIFKLETNYRSTPEIVTLANDNISHNTRRLPKELRAVKESGVKPAVVPCFDHNMQAEFITAYVRHLLAEGYQRCDIAVLYRSHFHSMEIQLEFKRHKIPFMVRGGLRFFEQAHIKDIMAYLRIFHNPGDETAWLRILQHVEGIGDKLASRVFARINAAENPLLEAAAKETVACLTKRAQPGYQKLTQIIKKLSGMYKPSPMIQRLFDDFYEEYMLANFENVQTRRDDIRGTIEFAGQYEDLQSLLSDMALASEYSGVELDYEQEAGEEDSVVLSTIHQAKGLEWKIVFVPWLVEGRFPADYSLSEHDGQEEEERRIFHVAVTRAENELYLLVPRTGKTRGMQGGYLEPSRFLKELGNDIYEPLIIDTGVELPHNANGFPRAKSRNRQPRDADCKSSGSPDEPVYEYDEEPGASSHYID